METKICSKCKKEKPISEFGKNKAKKDGLQAECKECKSAYNKLHYQKNKETYLAKAPSQFGGMGERSKPESC